MERQQPAPQRKPFSPEERRLIREAIAQGRMQRIRAGGWSNNKFGSLLDFNGAINELAAVRIGGLRRR